ncbi:glycosyltransferase family 2 protein [Paucibacter sp. XJ19-41]|uniref:glycosyltransferase family 2 protein n=1 Tax=Paucibacter sp. XJ19-41 TaxID=2927824 RepID=UPI00234BE52B|nr:glycosyltransferase family 2 protein [Paucibacter sp. XJ19-41]MDC6166108.1 glycosyltransferase family 2 protein [Paucibacter sp. XJ19-41]
MNTEKQRILVSILNWNSTPDTLACLQPLTAPAVDGIDCLVLDNGSTVDTTEQIRLAYPGVEVLRTPVNLGFTGGHNLVFKLALQRGYGSVLILNNDCSIAPDAIRRLQQVLDQHGDVAAVSPLIYTSSATPRPQAVAGWLDWRRQRSVYPSEPGVAAPEGLPTHVLGTALLLRCAALRQIGLLDERYFAYYEDNDLSARIAQHGYRALYCDSATALHRSRDISEYSAMALYLSARNSWLFWGTHTPMPYRRGMRRRLLSQSLYNLALLKKKNAAPVLLDAVVDGCWDALRGRYGAPSQPRGSSPWLLRRLATIAPYLVSQLLEAPLTTLRRKLSPR